MKPKLTRRRHQKGQLIEARDRWEYRWREYYIDPADGQEKVKRRWDILCMKPCGKTEAERLLAAKIKIINRKEATAPKSSHQSSGEHLNTDGSGAMPVTPFAAFADKWLATIAIHHKPSTQLEERRQIERDLKPAFGSFLMRDMTAEVIQTWASGIRLSPKTVKNRVGTLRTMWKTAKAWGYAQHNPFEALALPRLRKSNVYDFSQEEAKTIISEARGWYKLFFLLLAETGMRPGEAAGLRPEDLNGQEIHVRQSVWGGNIQTPKTENSVRRFSLSAGLLEQLRNHTAESGPNRHGLIFVNKAGKPMNMDHFNQKVLRPILLRTGIWAKIQAIGGRAGSYAFRHMNATLMDSVLNTPLKTRQKRLGHADISTTLEHYTAAVDADDRAVAEGIRAIY